MLKEVPKVKIPDRYRVENSDTFNAGKKALFKFVNGESSAEEFTNQLKDYILSKNNK